VRRSFGSQNQLEHTFLIRHNQNKKFDCNGGQLRHYAKGERDRNREREGD